MSLQRRRNGSNGSIDQAAGSRNRGGIAVTAWLGRVGGIAAACDQFRTDQWWNHRTHGVAVAVMVVVAAVVVMTREPVMVVVVKTPTMLETAM